MGTLSYDEDKTPHMVHGKMKAAKLYRFHDIRVEDMPIPEVGPGDALIKTRACGICSGDVMQWYIEKKAPLVLGHEPAGEVVEVGGNVTSFKQGDRISPHHHAPCFHCSFCRREDYVQCATWRNSRIVPGGISEYILIPALNLQNDTTKLPESITYEDGTLIEPAACAVKGLKRAHLVPGDTVLVIGLGVMGMLHILIAREYKAGKIIGADMVPFRLEKARELGADAVIDVSKQNLSAAIHDSTKGEKAHVVIVGPNSVKAMKQGIECVSPGGQVLLFAPAKPGEQLTIDPNFVYFNDINIVSSYSCGPRDTAEACMLIERRVISAGKLITHRFPIERTAEAFHVTAQARASLKSLILFD